MTAGIVLHRFAGAGGWEEGARLAGYAGMQVGIELDPDACRTAVAAGHARIRADVTQFPLTRLAGKVLGCVESPPCPTWSTAGDGAGKVDLANVVRLIDDHAAGRDPGRYEWVDPRSALTAEPMRSVRTLRPRFVALEQVPPVITIWRYMAHKLRGLGYQVWTGFLSAEEYGVPQTRRRAILIARLDGSALPPAPTHQSYRSGREALDDVDLLGSPLPRWVSMAEALGWATGTIRTGNNSRVGAGETVDYERDTAAPAPTLTGNVSRWQMRNNNHANACTRDLDEPAGTIFFGRAMNSVVWMRSNYGTAGDPGDRGERRADEPAPTVTGKIGRNMWMAPAGASSQAVDPRSVDEPAHTITGKATAAWVHNRPATTVLGDSRVWPPGHKINADDRDRLGEQAAAERYGDRAGAAAMRVTVQEAGVLQSFRADYPWSGTQTKRYLQVGNAVPPLLAAAILRPLLASDSTEEVTL